MSSKEPIYVKESRFSLGVFASRDIKKDEKICTMRGKEITAEQLNLVTKHGRDILNRPVTDRR